jgi:hypothetical protein
MPLLVSTTHELQRELVAQSGRYTNGDDDPCTRVVSASNRLWAVQRLVH